ncbi:cell division protein ZapA [Methylophilaceae bacterium]|nr:cell division protein ZapA [Methylophilaceae bacterium]
MSKIVEINILGRDFQINCPDGEEEALLESAKYLNQKVNQLKDSGVTGFDRLLLMTSLNIIHESTNNNPENLTQLKLVQEKLNNFDTILDQALSNY